MFEQPGFVWADRLPKRIGDGALQTLVVLHRNKVRVIRPEPGQHMRVHFAVEVVHQERAEDRDVVLFGELIEQVLEVHAGGNVPALPQDIHHFSPPTHLWVLPVTTRLSDDVGGEARGNGQYPKVRWWGE